MPHALLIDTETASLPASRFKQEQAALGQDASLLTELERILNSPFFRSSQRSQEFLRHIVTYADVPGELKERTIGIAVFGRSADYDTGMDAIVRVKAVDLRKRLAQYNSTADPERSVRIELQAGSYLPKISYAESPESPAIPVPSNLQAELTEATQIPKASAPTSWKTRLPIPWMAGGAVALVLLTAILVIVYRSVNSPAQKFLRPFVTSASQPIICLSHPNAYNLSLATVKKKGDAPTAFRLRELLEREGRKPRLSVAADLTAEDLKNSPVILLGGPRHNRWTATLTQDLRFSFQVVDNTPRIIDRQDLSRFWQDPDQNDERSPDDYVVITRLLASQNTQPVLSIAGLRAQGTVAGAQIVFNEAALRQVLRYAPDNWDQKNMQLVLQVKFRGDDMPIYGLRAATYW